MLSRLANFYLIVNPSPGDTVITQRKDAITAFLSKLDDADLLADCVELAIVGLPGNANARQKTTAGAMMAAIQQQQPSLTGDIVSNALDVRVCAGVAVGEYLLQHQDSPTAATVPAAALVVSSLQTRPRTNERYIANFLDALLATARAVLDRTAASVRDRPPIQFGDIGDGEPDTIEAALRVLQKSVEKNVRADREELQILWWVFGAFSKLVAKPFRELDPATRALVAAAELAEISVLPPTIASSQFLAAVIREEGHFSLRQFVSTSPEVVMRRFSPSAGQVAETVRSHPTLLPLTWVLNRKLDSGVPDGWEAEFQQKTGMSADQERSLSDWSRQAFDECVALRLIVEPVLSDDDQDDETGAETEKKG